MVVQGQQVQQATTVYSVQEQWDFSEETGIQVRTLTYWRSMGWLGSLLRDGNKYFMTAQDRLKAEDLQRTRHNATEVLISMTLEGDEFVIAKVELTRRDGVIVAKMFTKQGDFLIKELPEEALNGLQ